MKVETREIQEETVTITMTEKEAEVLVSVVGGICGDMGGPRGVMDRLYAVLGTSGISLSPTAVVTTLMQLDKKVGE